MLGWPLCNFAQGPACVKSTANISIWTTVLRNAQLVSLALPQGFPAMRRAITISLQSESSFVQTCTPWFCGCVQALLQLGLHLVLHNITMGQCFVFSSALSLCVLNVTALLLCFDIKWKLVYDLHLSAIQQNQGHWVTYAYYFHTWFGPSFNWSTKDIFLASLYIRTTLLCVQAAKWAELYLQL